MHQLNALPATVHGELRTSSPRDAIRPSPRKTRVRLHSGRIVANALNLSPHGCNALVQLGRPESGGTVLC